MPSEKIAIVEDEQVVAMDLEAHLIGLGYEVRGVFASAEECLSGIQKEQPDLIMMDVRLKGGMSGIEAAKKVRARWNIPIVFCTAYSDEETLKEVKQAEPFGFIHKPFDTRELRTTLEIALYKHSLEKKLLESERKYRSMMEAITDPIYICSPDHYIEYMNPSMIRLIGRDATGELCHKALYNLEKPCEWCAADKIKAGLPVRTEFFDPLRGSTYRISNVPITNSDGSISHMSILTDITEQKKAARALQESQERYKRLVESVTDYIYTVTIEDGKVVSTRHGPACVTVTGYSSEDYQADPDLWYKMVHIEDRPKVLEQAERLLRGESCPPLEHRIIHKNGKVQWVRNVPVLHRDVNGKLIGYDGMISNITERKLAEEAIKEHVKRLELINKVILAVNRADEISAFLTDVMQPVMDFFKISSGAIYLQEPKKETARLVGIYGKVSEMYALPPVLEISDKKIDSEANKNKLLKFDLISDKNNALSAIQEMVCLPLFSKEQTIGLLVFTSSLTKEPNVKEAELLFAIGRQIGTAIAKMRSEAALRESENRYRTITQQALIGVQIFRGGELLFTNEGWSKITGYPCEETAGWKLNDYMSIVHPDDRAFLRDQIEKVESAKTFIDNINQIFDFRFLSRSGEIKWVLGHFKKIEFTEGDAVVIIIVDITDRKIAEQSLAAANQRLKAREEQLKTMNSELFAAIEQLKANQRELSAMNREKEVLIKEIHHRVKNNLQVISSLLKIQASHLKDEKAVMALKECQQRVKSIAIVHEKLYQFNNLAEIGLATYVEGLVNHLVMMFAIDPSRINVNFDIPNIPLTIEQAVPCSMIINELVSNALKYAFPDKRKGTITISLKEENDGFVRLIISDDGIGFPRDIDFKNTVSLGMQLVMTFAEQLGGEVTLQSEPERGTTFAIKFKLQRKTLLPDSINVPIASSNKK